MMTVLLLRCCRAKESEQMKEELMKARVAEKSAKDKLFELSRTPIPVSNDSVMLWLLFM